MTNPRVAFHHISMKISLLILLMTVLTLGARAEIKDNAKENRATLTASHKTNIAKLHAPAREALTESFKNFKISSLCQASISEVKQKEFALGLVSDDEKTAVFVALVKSGGQFKGIELSRHKLNMSDELFEVEAQCLNPKEAASLGATIEKSEGIEGGLKKLKTDLACVRPTDDPTTVNCFYWNKKAKKFASAGGWTT